jgi:transposase-like protein
MRVAYALREPALRHFKVVHAARADDRDAKPGPANGVADRARRRRQVYLKIDGRMVYPWRAVDAEGEVLDVLVQSKRDKHAALKLMRELLKKYAVAPERLVTDDLRSHGAAARDLGIESRHERGRWKKNRAENSHQPTRRRSTRCSASRAPAPRRNSSQPLRRVQHFQRPTPSHLSSMTPRAPRRGDEHVARGRRGRMKIRTLIVRSRSSRGNVTMPPRVLADF